MRTLWLDYETYYDDDYSLSKMIRTEYLNDPRFKAHGCSFAIDDGDFFWVTGTDLQAFFKDVSPHIDAMCCHNGLFDHGITGLLYMPERKFLMDTMSMAQVALARKNPGQRMSLAKLAQYYFPDNPEWWKFEGVLENFKGVYNLGSKEPIMAKYAIQDGVVMRELFKAIIREDVPWHTVLDDINLTLAMGVYPQLEMDTALAAAINEREVAEKEAAVKELKLDRAQLRSGEKFAALLRAEGVEPPLKKNPKGELIYAFASKDLEFMELADHPNPRVRALQALRIGEKSAQTMTRSARWMTLPTKLPIPLKVAGAHTGRHGGDEYNMQNPEKAGDLRKCIRAPKGHKVVVGDLAGIELRVNAWWCDERSLLDKWEIDPQFDVYSELSSMIYGREILKGRDDDERFNGKTSELACQFGAGAARIQLALRQKKVECDDVLANKIKMSYRRLRTRVVQRWAWLNDIAIPAMAGMTPPVHMNGVTFEYGRAVLPSGRSIYYPELHVNEEGDWVYKAVKKFAAYFKKLYGGALAENVVQAMAYDVFMFQQRKAAVTVRPVAMVVHDEGVFVIPDEHVQRAIAQLKVIYQTKPDWFQGVPIFGEFDYADTYGEAK